MLLSITTTHTPATDLGYLLHKNPSRVHSVDLGFGGAHVFYPEATESRCTASLLIDLDSLRLRSWQRRNGLGGDSVFDYVNDRPYVASSFMSVALTKVYGTALGGSSRERPELATTPLPLEATLVVAHCKGGDAIAHRVFGPLGYVVSTESHPLDTELGLTGGSMFTLRLAATKTLRELLTHLYVLVPVLDDQKHYAFGQDEVDKLISRGEEWLARHPERELIVSRYLRYRRRLTSEAMDRLLEPEETTEDEPEESEQPEERLERPIALHTRRLQAVTGVLKSANARRLLDLGCGEGRLIAGLINDFAFDEIVGVDVSTLILERARRRLRLERLPERQARRVTLLLGSLTYRDQRLRNFDAAAVVEVIEHLEPEMVARFSQALFGHARPRTVVVTTPNAEHNVRFEGLPPGRLRHPDHRFEWTREQFAGWATRTAEDHGYAVRFEAIGDDDPDVGPPTQMAVFTSQS